GRVNSKPTVATSSPSHAATATVPTVRRVFFPLDKQLALLPGHLTPLLQDQLTHLGVWMPFTQAAGMLARFTHTSVSESSAQRLTFGELYRRQLETAAQVASVSDGAEWIQGFIAFHAPSATRILDFPHAAQRICQIGEAVLGADHASLRAWQTRQLHDLKHQGAIGVLDHLRSFAVAQLALP